MKFYATTDLTVGRYFELDPNGVPVEDKDFVLESDQQARLVAGKSVTLQDGFHAKEGSDLHVHIAPEQCQKSGHDGGNSGKGKEKEGSSIPARITVNEELEKDSRPFPKGIRVVPNPTRENAALILRGDHSGKIGIKIRSLSGKVVMEKRQKIQRAGNREGSSRIDLRTKGLAKGLYFVTVNYSKNEKAPGRVKLVVE